jgi:CheY-like chemotaxis protein
MVEAGDRKRILVVDDEPQNIAILREILKAEYAVLAAADGLKALSLARSKPRPDLILLDVMMPGIDGFETLRRLKADPLTQPIPVVFVTSKGEIDDVLSGYEHGSTDYIAKPLDPAFILKVVHRVLRTR